VERRVKKKLRLVALVLVIALAVWFGANEVTNFLNPIRYVGEVAGEPGRYLGKPVQVTGFMVNGSLESKGNVHEFRLTDGEATLKVSYTGILPAELRDEAGVTAIGTLASADTIEANKLLVKCPSKYEQEYSWVAEEGGE